MTMRSMFLALVLFSTVSVAHAADRELEVRYGLDEAAFRKASGELFAAGYRLIDITVAEVAGKPVIGGVFQQTHGGPTGPERATQLQGLLFLRIRPTVISLLDYQHGFGHTELYAVPPGDGPAG